MAAVSNKADVSIKKVKIKDLFSKAYKELIRKVISRK